MPSALGVAQQLHDTLLQGVLSASMQLHVAVDGLPEDAPTKPALNRILQLMGQVIDEGRNTLLGLRSSVEDAHDLKIRYREFRWSQGTNKGLISASWLRAHRWRCAQPSGTTFTASAGRRWSMHFAIRGPTTSTWNWSMLPASCVFLSGTMVAELTPKSSSPDGTGTGDLRGCASGQSESAQNSES